MVVNNFDINDFVLIDQFINDQWKSDLFGCWVICQLGINQILIYFGKDKQLVSNKDLVKVFGMDIDCEIIMKQIFVGF